MMCEIESVFVILFLVVFVRACMCVYVWYVFVILLLGFCFLIGGG